MRTAYHRLGLALPKEPILSSRTSGRLFLVAPAIFYVNGVTGNDSTADGSKERPFATIQAGINCICGCDANLQQITLQIADGIYNESLWLYPVPGANPGGYTTRALCIQGNVLDPSRVVVNSANAICFTGIKCLTGWELTYLTLRSNVAAVNADAGTILYIGPGVVIDGQPAYGLISNFSGSFIEVVAGTIGYTINAYGPGVAYNHLFTEAGGQIVVSGGLVKILGTPNYVNGFALAAYGGQIWAPGVIYSGAALGPKYSIDVGGIILGSAAMPGNLAGANPGGWAR